MSPTLILGVPGLWSKPSEPILACAPKGYLWGGPKSVVLDPATSKRHPFSVEVYDPDPNLTRSIEDLSFGRIDPETLRRVAEHTMTLYVVSEEAPGVELCQTLMRFAGALLDAGGLAVKVETCGIAHSAETWREFLSITLPDIGALNAVTVRVAATDTGESYSCGMKHFGLPDAVMPGCGPEQTATLDLLNKYLLIEKPDMRDGQTFGVSKHGPVYRLRREPDSRFEPEHLFHNPYGQWRLEGPISSGTRRP